MRSYHRKRKQIRRHPANEIRNHIDGLCTQYVHDCVYAALLVSGELFVDVRTGLVKSVQWRNKIRMQTVAV